MQPLAFGANVPKQAESVSGSIIGYQDLLHRFGERELIILTDRAAKREIIADVLQKAIDDAEAEVWGYLRGAGFTQPFAVPPHALVVKTCDVCRWYLYENGIPEVVQKRYETAIAWLKTVMKNPFMLGFEADGVATAQVNVGMVVIANEVEAWKDADSTF